MPGSHRRELVQPERRLGALIDAPEIGALVQPCPGLALPRDHAPRDRVGELAVASLAADSREQAEPPADLVRVVIADQRVAAALGELREGLGGREDRKSVV